MRELRRALRFFGELLWDEGLKQPATEALEGAARLASRAHKRGSRRFARAAHGRGSFQAIVRVLARQQAEEAERAPRASLN
jgi:hypothetical protein